MNIAYIFSGYVKQIYFILLSIVYVDSTHPWKCQSLKAIEQRIKEGNKKYLKLNLGSVNNARFNFSKVKAHCRILNIYSSKPIPF